MVGYLRERSSAWEEKSRVPCMVNAYLISKNSGGPRDLNLCLDYVFLPYRCTIADHLLCWSVIKSFIQTLKPEELACSRAVICMESEFYSFFLQLSKTSCQKARVQDLKYSRLISIVLSSTLSLHLLLNLFYGPLFQSSFFSISRLPKNYYSTRCNHTECIGLFSCSNKNQTYL